MAWSSPRFPHTMKARTVIERPPFMAPEERRALFLRFFECTGCGCSLKDQAAETVLHCPTCETARFCCESCLGSAHDCHPIPDGFKGVAKRVGTLFPEVLAALQTVNRLKRADGMPPFRDEDVAQLMDDLFVSQHEVVYNGVVRTPNGVIAFLDEAIQREIVPDYVDAVSKQGQLKIRMQDILNVDVSPTDRAAMNELPPEIYYAAALTPGLHAELRTSMQEMLRRFFPAKRDRHQGLQQLAHLFHQVTAAFMYLDKLDLDDLDVEKNGRHLLQLLQKNHPDLFGSETSLSGDGVQIEDVTDAFWEKHMDQWQARLQTHLFGMYEGELPVQGASVISRILAFLSEMILFVAFAIGKGGQIAEWMLIGVGVILYLVVFYSFKYSSLVSANKFIKKGADDNANSAMIGVEQRGHTVRVLDENDQTIITYAGSNASRTAIKNHYLQTVTSVGPGTMIQHELEHRYEGQPEEEYKRSIIGGYSVWDENAPITLVTKITPAMKNNENYYFSLRYEMTANVMQSQSDVIHSLSVLRRPAIADQPDFFMGTIALMALHGAGAWYTAIASVVKVHLVDYFTSTPETRITAARILADVLNKKIRGAYHKMTETDRNHAGVGRPHVTPEFLMQLYEDPDGPAFLNENQQDISKLDFLRADNVLELLRKQEVSTDRKEQQSLSALFDHVFQDLQTSTSTVTLDLLNNFITILNRHVGRRPRTLPEMRGGLYNYLKKVAVIGDLAMLPLAASFLWMSHYSLGDGSSLLYMPMAITHGERIFDGVSAAVGAVWEKMTYKQQILTVIGTSTGVYMVGLRRAAKWVLSSLTSKKTKKKSAHDPYAISPSYTQQALSVLMSGPALTVFGFFISYPHFSVPDLLALTTSATALPVILAHGSWIPGAVTKKALGWVVKHVGEVKSLPALDLPPLPSKAHKVVEAEKKEEINVEHLAAAAVESNHEFERILCDICDDMSAHPGSQWKTTGVTMERQFEELRLATTDVFTNMLEYLITDRPELLPSDNGYYMPPAFMRLAAAISTIGQTLTQTGSVHGETPMEQVAKQKQEEIEAILVDVFAQRTTHPASVSSPSFDGRKGNTRAKHKKRMKKEAAAAKRRKEAELEAVEETLAEKLTREFYESEKILQSQIDAERTRREVKSRGLVPPSPTRALCLTLAASLVTVTNAYTMGDIFSAVTTTMSMPFTDMYRWVIGSKVTKTENVVFEKLGGHLTHFLKNNRNPVGMETLYHHTLEYLNQEEGVDTKIMVDACREVTNDTFVELLELVAEGRTGITEAKNVILKEKLAAKLATMNDDAVKTSYLKCFGLAESLRPCLPNENPVLQNTTTGSAQPPPPESNDWASVQHLQGLLGSLYATIYSKEPALIAAVTAYHLVNLDWVAKYARQGRLKPYLDKYPILAVGTPILKYGIPLALSALYQQFFTTAVQKFLLTNGLIEFSARLAYWYKRTQLGTSLPEVSFNTTFFDLGDWMANLVRGLQVAQHVALPLSALALSNDPSGVNLWSWSLVRVFSITAATTGISGLMHQLRVRGHIQGMDGLPPWFRGHEPTVWKQLFGKDMGWHLAWALPTLFAFHLENNRTLTIVQMVTAALSVAPLALRKDHRTLTVLLTCALIAGWHFGTPPHTTFAHFIGDLVQGAWTTAVDWSCQLTPAAIKAFFHFHPVPPGSTLEREVLKSLGYNVTELNLPPSVSSMPRATPVEPFRPWLDDTQQPNIPGITRPPAERLDPWIDDGRQPVLPGITRTEPPPPEPFHPWIDDTHQPVTPGVTRTATEPPPPKPFSPWLDDTQQPIAPGITRPGSKPNPPTPQVTPSPPWFPPLPTTPAVTPVPRTGFEPLPKPAPPRFKPPPTTPVPRTGFEPNQSPVVTQTLSYVPLVEHGSDGNVVEGDYDVFGRKKNVSRNLYQIVESFGKATMEWIQKKTKPPPTWFEKAAEDKTPVNPPPQTQTPVRPTLINPPQPQTRVPSTLINPPPQPQTPVPPALINPPRRTLVQPVPVPKSPKH